MKAVSIKDGSLSRELNPAKSSYTRDKFLMDFTKRTKKRKEKEVEDEIRKLELEAEQSETLHQKKMKQIKERGKKMDELFQAIARKNTGERDRLIKEIQDIV